MGNTEQAICKGGGGGGGGLSISDMVNQKSYYIQTFTVDQVQLLYENSRGSLSTCCYHPPSLLAYS